MFLIEKLNKFENTWRPIFNDECSCKTIIEALVVLNGILIYDNALSNTDELDFETHVNFVYFPNILNDENACYVHELTNLYYEPTPYIGISGKDKN